MPDRADVAGHLKIPLHEYDARIRTFVPSYDAMLGEIERLVEALTPERPTLVELGIGTGALAERCLAVRPEARLVGIDSDPAILELARARLPGRDGIRFEEGSYLEVELPSADAIVASISLHHVPEAGVKKQLYARCRRSLGTRGVLLLADCYPPSHEELARRGRAAWRRHLERHYTPDEAGGYFEAWSREDTYFTLAEEMDWLGEAGFRPEVVWRQDLFAVLLCT